MSDKPHFSSIIFDMDGTLWDAVDTYVDIWNETYRRIGADAHTTREQLIDCMGMTLDRIIARIAPVDIDTDRFVAELRRVDAELMPAKGGRLYPDVRSGIERLSLSYRLFMVSNCGPNGLDYFLQYTQMADYIEATLTNGQTHLSKAENIALLIRNEHLTDAVYVGDTASDCAAAHAAGIPMIYMTYGFGKCTDADYTMHSFAELVDFLLPPHSSAT